MYICIYIYVYVCLKVWVDDRLTWNISDYENITEILTSRAIWKPDITLYGE